MYIDYTPEQKALQKELREYFAKLFTPELWAELAEQDGGGPLYRKTLHQMGADGWLGIGWPKEYGGLGRSPVDEFIFFDEVQREGFPIPFLTLNTVGPTIMEHGTEEQKAKFLPAILRGDVHFSIGYTEPEAGTDLASLSTRAVREGDVYVVNGQKVFTSLANYADYIWLAVRTDPDARKHKGISILIVDTSLPGVQVSPTRTLGGDMTFTTYYENVRVPVSCLVGPENGGWKLITMQLNHERIALTTVGPVARFLTEVRDWARETRTADGNRVIDRPWVQQNLAQVHAKLEVLKLLNWRQACNLSRGFLHYAEASTVKVYGSEFYIEAFRLLLEVLGEAGSLKKGSPGAPLKGRLEHSYRVALVLTFGAGTNEIQREIIAVAGLGMPRSR